MKKGFFMKNRKYYIAIDIGPSTGRHAALWIEEGKLQIKELYRFDNRALTDEGHFYWNMELITQNIIEGLVQAKRQGVEPVSIGIDTWGADYLLLNRKGDILGEAYAFWDERTKSAVQEAQGKIAPQALYDENGLAHQSFNTLYQLLADKGERPNVLYAADHLLMAADYLTFFLTGTMYNEYTNATTTGLVGAKSRLWLDGVIKTLDLPQKLFGQIVHPGTRAGRLLPEIAQEVGFEAEVIAVASHDTASALMGTPLLPKALYLSSGAFSMMGVEEEEANVSVQSFLANISNEGGYDHTYGFQKNMMGLWFINALRRESGEGKTFGDLINLAQTELSFPSRINTEDRSLFAPGNMAKAINGYCEKTGQKVPRNLGQQLACVYHSLAENYQKSLAQIEAVQQKTYDAICVVGGGSMDRLLNQLTANACGKRVLAGPAEAAALGNGICQMIADGVFPSLKAARKAIEQSFEVTTYLPQQTI